MEQTGGQTRFSLLRRVYDSLVRQLMGLPHNKTRFQVNAAYEAATNDRVRQQCLTLVSKASGKTEAQYAQYHQEAETLTANPSEAEVRWTQSGRSLMGVRDRMSLYILLAAFEPDIVVETGTSGGASATLILENIARRGKGRMYSVDIESKDAHEYGILIPEPLKKWWELRLQKVTPILPALMAELKSIDFFLHDSDHYFTHMQWEFETAWTAIRPGGVLASHDIFYTSAFDDFGRRHQHEISGGGSLGNLGFWVKKRS